MCFVGFDGGQCSEKSEISVVVSFSFIVTFVPECICIALYYLMNLCIILIKSYTEQQQDASHFPDFKESNCCMLVDLHPGIGVLLS